MTRFPWLWPTIIIVSAIAVSLVTFVSIAFPLRPLVALWFLLICPGMAWVRLLRIQEAVAEWTLAAALSLALDAIVAMAMLYAGMWSPREGLVLLIGISVTGAVLQLTQKYGPLLTASPPVVASKSWRWQTVLAITIPLLFITGTGIALLRLQGSISPSVATDKARLVAEKPSSGRTAIPSPSQSEAAAAASPSSAARPTNEASGSSTTALGANDLLGTPTPHASTSPSARAALGSTPPVTTTPSPTPTPTPTAAPSVARFAEDSFDVATSGWPVRTTETTSMGYVDGHYQLTLNGQTNLGVATLLPAERYRLSTDVTVSEGAAGVTFLAVEPAMFYRIMLTNDGRYSIQQVQLGSDTPTNVVGWTVDAALQRGPSATNRLRIERQGGTVRFFANDQLLTEFAVPPGRLLNQYGFALTSPTAHGQATFDNLVGERLDTP